MRALLITAMLLSSAPAHAFDACGLLVAESGWRNPGAATDEPQAAEEQEGRLLLLGLAVLGIPIGLLRLHGRTEGRSSPAAALGFVVGGPLLGVVLLIMAAIEEARRVAAAFQPPQGVLGLSALEFCFVMLATGLATALVFGLIYTATIRDELPDTKEEGGRPKPVASPDLKALGLTAFDSLEDIERAYREAAKKVHPDRGGDEAKFKRLQQHYEAAKRFVRRTK